MSPHEMHGIPWNELIIPQAVNFTGFFILLIYFLRKPLKAHFSGKTEAFEELRKKAEETKVNAEKQNSEVRNQLRVLDESTSKNLKDAEVEAQQTRSKIIQDGKATAQKLSEDAEKMAHFEYLRAIATLREELVLNSTKMAEENMKKALSESIQTKLNNDFINKVRAVNI